MTNLLNLNNIFSFNNPLYKNNFIHDKLRNCYRPNEKKAELQFNINLGNPGQYILAIKYNSVREPKLKFFLNDVLLCDSILKHKTGTYDRLLNFRYEIGPINFNNNYNLLKFEADEFFPDIYNIELYPYKKEEIVKNPYYYKVSDFVLVESYNIHGGFFWHLNNYMICCFFCELNNKIPIVNFNSSLFMNNTTMENPLLVTSTNWFYNYFENPINIPPTIYNTLLTYPIKKNLDLELIKKIENNESIEDEILLNFNRNTFVTYADKFHPNKSYYPKIINKYFKFQKKILKEIETIKQKVLPKKDTNTKFIGIHYRGTDKIAEPNALEQRPIHNTYERVIEVLIQKEKELIQNQKNLKIYFIVTSDEQPFIEFMTDNLGEDKVIYYNGSSRSNIKTSGIGADFTDIPTRNIQINPNELSQDQFVKYQNRESLINNSLHLGFKNVSNYKKGLDCLIDTLILQDCDILYRSRGNFSMFCHLFNRNKDLELIELNDI